MIVKCVNTLDSVDLLKVAHVFQTIIQRISVMAESFDVLCISFDAMALVPFFAACSLEHGNLGSFADVGDSSFVEASEIHSILRWLLHSKFEMFFSSHLWSDFQQFFFLQDSVGNLRVPRWSSAGFMTADTALLLSPIWC